MSNTSEWPTDDIERTIDKYGDMLYRLSLIMLKNESDAEDVVQETIIKYYQKKPNFVDFEHEKAWLIKVATNKCKDIFRLRKRYAQFEESFFIKDMEETLDYEIIEALVALPEKYRLVMALYYIEEYRIDEIAKMINRTPSAVKMRLQKGRKLLKEIYEGEQE